MSHHISMVDASTELGEHLDHVRQVGDRGTMHGRVAFLHEPPAEYVSLSAEAMMPHIGTEYHAPSHSQLQATPARALAAAPHQLLETGLRSVRAAVASV